MKFLRRLLRVLLVLILLLAGTAFLLPDSYEVERAILIDAPATTVYTQVAELRNWPKWDPWTDRDANLVYTYPGKSTGIGATQKWTSTRYGQGERTLTRVVQPALVRLVTTFSRSGEQQENEFEFESAGGTRVTWRARGHIGWNPLDRWLGLLKDERLAPEMQRGLEKLARVTETTN